MNKLRIASAIDDNYVFPLIMLFYFASTTTYEKLTFIIAFDESKLSVENRNLIRLCALELKIEIEFRKIKLQENQKNNFHISSTAYARLFLADEIGGKFIWLDSDLMLMPGWDVRLKHEIAQIGDAQIAGVRDSIMTTERNIRNSSNLALQNMGKNYFNSGVVIINSDIWQANKMPFAWRQAMDNYDIYGFEYSDQCILNFVSQESFKLMSFGLNVLNISSEKRKKEVIYIKHFAGNVKPWEYFGRSYLSIGSALNKKDIYLYVRSEKKLIKFFNEINSNLGQQLLDKATKLAKKRSNFELIKVNNQLKMILRLSRLPI